ALNALLAEFARQRNEFHNFRVTTMKAGIEARDLRHAGQLFEDCFNRGQVMWLMEWSERNELIEFAHHFGVHDCWAFEARATVDQAMAPAGPARAAVFGT